MESGLMGVYSSIHPSEESMKLNSIEIREIWRIEFQNSRLICVCSTFPRA